MTGLAHNAKAATKDTTQDTLRDLAVRLPSFLLISDIAVLRSLTARVIRSA
jgi:hypothetical protein